MVDFDEVLAAARDGEALAWRQIYGDLSPRLLGYLRARAGADAEDLLAETFLQIVRDLPRFSGDEGAFRAWAFTIAHRRVVDAMRKRATADAALERHETREPIGDVEAEALDAIDRRELLALLETLSYDQRTVLLLRLFGDLTIAEIAAIIGKTEGATKALQRRALGNLQRALRKEAVPL